MKKIIGKIAVALILLTLFGCSTDSSTDDTKTEENNQNQDSEKTGDTKKDSENEDNDGNGGKAGDDTASVTVTQYFWGEWQRMDNGEIYVIDETGVTVGDSAQNYRATSSTEESLAVSALGTFTKQSDSVMTNGAIPYFRKGGTNLSYTMKLVGFEENIARAASSVSLAGWKATGKSGTYASYSDAADSDGEGNITLTAPTKGDVQTVTVQSENTVVVVPGIKVENDGSNMGTIPISEAGQYSLKVTGTIPDEEKDDGYLFGNNYKEYPMTLTITNVSEVTSAPSVCTITAADSRLSVSSSDGSDISGGVLISTLKSGFTKTIDLKVSCGAISEGYMDTGIRINVQNAATGKNWIDFIPIRFYAGLTPIAVAAENVEANDSAALNGFVIYPDGNSQFFAVPTGGSKTVYVPTFKNTEKYLLAFCGATIKGELSESTEMLYTVAQGTSVSTAVDKSSTAFVQSVQFGETDGGNETEDSAYSVSETFQAYLAEGETDFYIIKLKGVKLVKPDFKPLYTVSYKNDSGSSPDSLHLENGVALTSENLPILSRDYYTFEGWYIGTYKVEEGYVVSASVTLTAKWKPIEYTITYELNGGTNASTNFTSYTVESEAITLSEPARTGYTFSGWYENKDFEGSVVTAIKSGSTGNRTFYAKWTAITYSITYNLNGGTNNSANPVKYTIENAVPLATPTRTGYTFSGWYSNADYTGSAITQINTGNTGDMTLYAKWTPTEYAITYELNGGTNASANPNSYTIESETITLSEPTMTGYTFTGWYESADFAGNAVTTIPVKSVGSRTFYAKWEVVTYSISYELNGGTLDSDVPITYTVETQSFALPIPTRNNYDFVGWYQSSDFSDEANTSLPTTLAQNITIYAKWIPTVYAITYELNGGTNASANPNSYTIESETITLSEPTRADYTFCGWYEAAEFTGNAVTEINKGCSGAKIFIAKWETVTYSITYELNYGKFDTEVVNNYTVESDSFNLPIPTRDDYVFLGWYTEADFSGNKVSKIKKGTIGNQFLYALYGKELSSDENIVVVNEKNLSSFTQYLTGGQTVLVVGNLNHSALKTVISKIATTEVKINLNLSMASGLASIERRSFEDCNCIIKLVLPDSIISIGDYAFSCCSSLRSIIIPSSVKTIEELAFWGCTSLSAVVIPNGVENIETSTFMGCSKLSTVNIPDSVTSIGSMAFAGCSNLTNINIPDSVTNIGGGAFDGCTSLKSISIPVGVTSLGSYTFYRCSALTNITIPASVERIGRNCFDGCSKLKTINFAEAAYWYYTDDSDYTGGTRIRIEKSSSAIDFTSAIVDYYWYKE